MAIVITAKGAFGGSMAICANCKQEMVEYFDTEGNKKYVVFMAQANEGFCCPDGQEHSIIYTN